MNILWGSYILIGLYTIILSVFFRKKARKKWFLILVSIQLIIVFAIRDVDVGVDLTRYYRSYKQIEDNNFFYIINNQEYFSSILFYILMYICTRLGVTYHTFLGMVGIICVVPYCYFINKYSDHPYISIIIHISMGIYAFQFSGLKQSIAMAIIMFAFDAVIEQKKKKFYIFIIFAMLFHITAIVCLPIYALYRIRYRNWMILPIICSLVLVYIFRNPIGQFVTILFSEGEYVGRYDSSGNIGTTSLFLVLILSYIMLFAHNYIRNYEMLISYYFKLILVSTFIQIMSAYAYSFTRLNYYYMQFLPLVISNIIDLPINTKFKNKKISNVVLIVIYIFLFLLSTYMYNVSVINGNNTINYQVY